MSSNATVYAAAPLNEVVPLLGDLAQYADVDSLNDGYESYSCLIELETLDADETITQARKVAEVLSSHGISVGIAFDGDPEPYVSSVDSAAA